MGTQAQCNRACAHGLKMDITQLKQKLDYFGLTPNKALGQNFLADDAAAKEIAHLACKSGLPVLEIGPGLGALTEYLVQDAPCVAAVEIDKAMVEALKSECAPCTHLHIIHRDFLKLEEREITAILGESFAVAANLPYYITTPICMRLLCFNAHIESLTLMLQKEAAERFYATPRSRNYTPLSVLANLYYNIESVILLSPQSYYPQPDVDSLVLHLARKKDAAQIPLLPNLLNAAFAMRRKTLANNLRAMGFGKEDAQALLSQSEIPFNARAEELEPHTFVKLCEAINR